MQARAIELRDMPALTASAAAFSEFANAFHWALQMRSACRDWERSGRQLDGDAIHRIAASLPGGTR